MSRQIAIVTGASRGIGAATVLRLARDGFDVCINYLSNHEAAESIKDVAEQSGVKAIAVQADIADESQVKTLFDVTCAELGRPTTLVNNAAILLPQSRVIDMTQERMNQLFAVNITGSFLCAKEAVRSMSQQHGGNGGSIVNVSSAAARLGAAGEYVDYAASKGAVDTLTIGLAKEVAAEGIRVNGVRPGFIYTDMHASGGEPDRVNRIKQSLPMQRGGQPEEVAAAIAWLVSDQSSYCTGTIIDVAGGR